jgi:hypothetical protein
VREREREETKKRKSGKNKRKKEHKKSGNRCRISAVFLLRCFRQYARPKWPYRVDVGSCQGSDNADPNHV